MDNRKRVLPLIVWDNHKEDDERYLLYAVKDDEPKEIRNTISSDSTRKIGVH